MRNVLPVRVLLAAVVAAGVSAMQTQQAIGQVASRCDQIRALVEKTNVASSARYRKEEEKWQKRFDDMGSKDTLKRVAQYIASLEQKFDDGFSLLDSSTGQRRDSVHEAFRKHVVDERQLAHDMAATFAKFEQEMIRESTALYIKAGIDRESAEIAWTPKKQSLAHFERGFNPVIAKARSLASRDWFRTGMLAVGTAVIADDILDGDEDEEMTFESFITGLITHFVVEAAMDEMLDPTDTFCRELGASFDKAESEFLYGKSGLLTLMKQVTETHQKVRFIHLGLPVKGGE